MDNITHSLVGAALSEIAVRESATPTDRRLFLAAGILSSNLPDLDLLYVGLTPPPLGYLLHHRGHTHTLVGLVVQGLLGWMLCRLVPAVRRLAAGDRTRLLSLIAAGLLGHELLDAGNNYGVHPFYPFDRRWYYGDAVFIFEPWLWLLLGLAAAWNARSPLARAAIIGGTALLPMALASAGAIPGRALAGLAVVGPMLAWTVRRLSPRARAAAALGASALFVLILFGLSRWVRKETIARVTPETRGEIVDVVRYPNPAWPLCWAVIVIEKDERGGEFVLRRGTLSLLPAWPPAAQCASRWLARIGPARASGDGGLAWERELRAPLQGLRDLAARDCGVRAWLQFGRAPYLRADDIRDLRFETAGRENFTALRLRPASEAAQCPPHMTSWAMPRADLLEPSP